MTEWLHEHLACEGWPHGVTLPPEFFFVDQLVMDQDEAETAAALLATTQQPVETPDKNGSANVGVDLCASQEPAGSAPAKLRVNAETDLDTIKEIASQQLAAPAVNLAVERELAYNARKALSGREYLEYRRRGGVCQTML